MLCPDSTDRVVQLIGSVAHVVSCLQAICELLEVSISLVKVYLINRGRPPKDHAKITTLVVLTKDLLSTMAVGVESASLLKAVATALVAIILPTATTLR